MTTRTPQTRSLFRRIIDRLGGRDHTLALEVDYDALVGVEHHGAVVLLITRDGGRRPLTFTSSKEATAWFGRAQSGLLARRDELKNPPDLARLSDTLTQASKRPWATQEHLTSLLMTSLSHASVSSATLERSAVGVTVRCTRHGRLHLSGTIAAAPGKALMDHLGSKLGGAASQHLHLHGCFPGPALKVEVTTLATGLRVRPLSPPAAFSDLSTWGAESQVTLSAREVLSRRHGLVLVCGRGDSGKSTLAKVCAREAQVLARHGDEPLIIDEISDRRSALAAIQGAERGLVIATLRAEDVQEALDWLRSLQIRRGALTRALSGILEARLLPVECARCGGEGCTICQRSGISHRRGALVLAQLDPTRIRPDTVPPFERERRKLTA